KQQIAIHQKRAGKIRGLEVVEHLLEGIDSLGSRGHRSLLEIQNPIAYLSRKDESLLQLAKRGVHQQKRSLARLCDQHRAKSGQTRMIREPPVVERITEALLDQPEKLLVARRRRLLYPLSPHKLVHRAFDVGEIVAVKLLIGTQRGPIEMLDSDVVLLGDREQRVYQRACFGRLPSKQLEHLRRRDSKQMIWKSVEHRRAEKVR